MSTQRQRQRQRKPQATVIGDSEATPEAKDAARKIGQLLARRGITVITGGRGGVMEAVCQGASDAGGLAIGILPSEDLEDANPWCQVVIPTGLGHARNALTALAGDLVIAIGGAAGTLSELCFAWMHGKPILAMKDHSGWSGKLAGQAIDHRSSSKIIECSSLEELDEALIKVCSRLGLRISC